MDNETFAIISAVVVIVGAIIAGIMRGGGVVAIINSILERLWGSEKTINTLEKLHDKLPDRARNRLRDISDLFNIGAKNTEIETLDELARLLTELTDELPYSFEAQIEAKRNGENYGA